MSVLFFFFNFENFIFNFFCVYIISIMVQLFLFGWVPVRLVYSWTVDNGLFHKFVCPPNINNEPFHTILLFCRLNARRKNTIWIYRIEQLFFFSFFVFPIGNHFLYVWKLVKWRGNFEHYTFFHLYMYIYINRRLCFKVAGSSTKF